MVDVAQILKDFRRLSGMSQREFAEKFDIPQTTWSGYESGKFPPPMGVLFALKEKGGYSIPGLTDELFIDEKTKKALNVARDVAKRFPPKTPLEDESYRKAVKEAQERENFPEGGLIWELEKAILRTIDPRIANHETRLETIEERLKALQSAPQDGPALPDSPYPPETGGGEGFTAEPEPEYGEEETARIVAFHEDVAAGPPVGQSEDGGWEVAVPRRLIKTRPEDYYVLQVRGNSMFDALIPDGSLVLIRWSDVPRDGIIQVVRIDGRATLKRVREGQDHSWTLHYEDGTAQTIPLGEDNRVQGDFVAVLPPSTRPRMRGE
jgi:SOS-response transcriptional repressor LexA/DNA-binding XRE family transcriptional regulator